MDTEKLYIALVQFDLSWRNPLDNRKKLDNLFTGIQDPTHLIVLPEMFTTGFTPDPERVAETMDGPTVAWMLDKARSIHATLAGSMIIREKDRFFNRLILTSPSGRIQWYDKRHLFSMEGEEDAYSPGVSRLIVDLNGWHISFLICYDLRFPVWSRNQRDVDLLVYSANWPSARDDVWTTLLKARAIENQCYVAGVNRVGIDGRGIRYIGKSRIIDPKGNKIASLNNPVEGILRTTVSLPALHEFRNHFPVWKDWDHFQIQ